VTVTFNTGKRLQDRETDAAAGPPIDFGQEIRLGNGGMAIAQVTRGVLDQEPPPERLLDLVEMATEDIKALLGIKEATTGRLDTLR
jgi:hypothetical protein